MSQNFMQEEYFYFSNILQGHPRLSADMENWAGWKREFSSKPAPTLRATIYFRMKGMIRSCCKQTSLDHIKRIEMVKIRFWGHFLEYLQQ